MTMWTIALWYSNKTNCLKKYLDWDTVEKEQALVVGTQQWIIDRQSNWSENK